MIPTQSETMLLTLLRSALWDTAPEIACFESATQTDWQACIRQAVKQGVQGIVFDAAMQLPAAWQPSRKQKIAWAVNVEIIEKRFEQYRQTAAHLACFYQQQGLSVMLLKGLGLATYYPVPAHREGGDLDIWLFGAYAQGNQLMEAQGIAVEEQNPKHACFRFEGIQVENHRNFVDVALYAMDRDIVEPALHHILKDQPCSTLPLPEDTSMLIPPPLFNALFLARHMYRHFTDNSSLRHLTDWARFLHLFRGQYDTIPLSNLLKEAGILPVIRIFTELCIEQLGMPADCSPFVDTSVATNKKLKALIWNDILRSTPSTFPERDTPCQILAYKWHRLRATQWKYKLIVGRGITWRLMLALFHTIIHPTTLLKENEPNESTL